MSIEDLSPSERELMEILWERGAVSARAAREALPRDVARNTVRTLLERMEGKGWCAHREEGRTYIYYPVRPREESIGRKVRELIDTFCGGSPETLVAALIDFRGLRRGELERIRKMLEDAKARRVSKS